VNQIPREDGPKSGAEEKEELMKKAQTAGQKSNKIEYKGCVDVAGLNIFCACAEDFLLRERIVKDPVTGQDVIVKDAQKNCKFAADMTSPKDHPSVKLMYRPPSLQLMISTDSTRK
jgi:hypothetical protein